jgi:hypothetical protein
VGANLLRTIPNIKVHYILVAKFPHGKKSLNILSTSFPNPNLPFCNCVHEVNMTHTWKYLTHSYVAAPVLTPSPRHYEFFMALNS